MKIFFQLDLEREKCLKLWEGHCKFDRTSNGVAKFLRHHFLRAYYKNRAPVILHFSSEWLKEFHLTTRTEIIPDIGYAKKEKTKITIEHKEYRNLDGLMKFINNTLNKNKDVYFVTASQAVEWMRNLPRIAQEKHDLKKFLEEELFENCPHDAHSFEKVVYNGECVALKQLRPDYDVEEGYELDDNFAEELSKKLRIIHSKKNSILTDLQSEVLFLNKPVIAIMIIFVIILFLIIMKDKYF